MAREIERKFLVTGTGYRSGVAGQFRQGYVCLDPGRTVRVRVAGGRGFLTLKGKAEGIGRDEFEYEIPLADAAQLLARLCTGPLIEKTRYLVEHEGHTWEVDEFAGDNAGLVVAEIELQDENETFARPPWLGTEVSSDSRYANSRPVTNPYKHWRD